MLEIGSDKGAAAVLSTSGAFVQTPSDTHLVQGTLGVLGPTRMHYERAITAVAYVAQLFSETLSKI